MTALTEPRRIVVGYDGSAGSRAAIEHAVDAAGAHGCVYVVHAYPRPRSWLSSPTYQQRLDVALDSAESLIEDLQATRGPLDRVAWEPEIVGDDPAKAIAVVAAARHADEIVVGGRGLGVARALRGSVAADLIRLAEVPVTVIPPRVTARAA
jgi:nucleotide-binding universal stress UspA family protein